MQHGIHLDAKTKAAIVSALKDGQRPLAIERTFRVSGKTVARLRREAELPAFRPPVSAEERMEILDAIEKGQSSTAIAAAFNRSRSFIWKIRRNQGREIAAEKN
jgi:DNA invertase Pin-like site-specific DNA recombinase